MTSSHDTKRPGLCAIVLYASARTTPTTRGACGGNPSLRARSVRPARGAALAAAWSANEGYAFQLHLIAARIAAAPERFDEGAWPAPALARLRWVIAAAHRARHGRRPTECTTCRPVRLAWRAAHALDLRPGGLPSWYAP